MKQMILIGFMGAGKSTVGKLLAQKVQLPYLDLDEYLEKKYNLSIDEYFSQYGEASFREKEKNLLKELSQTEGVLSTGGGIITNEESRSFLKNNPSVIYLKTSFDELLLRLKADQKNIRPMILEKTEAEINSLYLSRVIWYEDSAKIHVETTNRSLEAIVQEIIEKAGDI
ncbi:MAG TPA: shikimate kinase [Candidatus Tetragenococcus pullicola]|nr:shikimate kinase [Candidatus Tetragenococcus pullicola]